LFAVDKLLAAVVPRT